MTWLILMAAILSEVVGTTALKLSAGFTRLVPSVVVAVGYLAAFALLSQALARGLAVSVAYAVWAGAGVALVAVIGTVFLSESLTWLQGAGIALVVLGVLAIELGAQY